MSVTFIKKSPKVEAPVFNPMLAAEGVLGKIKYPQWALPKQNGVRGGLQNGSLLARSLKPIPNIHTRQTYEPIPHNGMEGELVVGPFDAEDVFTASTSGVMSVHGTPDVHWYMFDLIDKTLPFSHRYEKLSRLVESTQASGRTDLSMIPHRIIHNDDELQEYASQVLSQGYEGLVLRGPGVKYKNGRATADEQSFMRFCPWIRGEAVILGIEEGEINLNPSVVNELGFKKKSSHKANKIGSGMAGAFVCKDLKTGIEHKMPVPTVALQKDVWTNPNKYLSKIAHYKFKPAVKPGGKPRFPQYEGLRDPRDMS